MVALLIALKVPNKYALPLGFLGDAAIGYTLAKLIQGVL